MTLKKGDFIKINYTGKLETGAIFDTTIETVARENNIYNDKGIYGGDVVIIGAKNTIDGLDESFIDKNIGDEIEIKLTPEKAFGESNPKLIESISTSKFKNGNITVGSIIEKDGKQGIISRIIGRRATVDFNNPLSGKNVIYKYKIESLITNIDEKINGLLLLYAGIKSDHVEVIDNIATVFIPTTLTFNHRWIVMKGKMIQDILKYTDIQEVRFVEKYTKEDKNQ